MVLSSRAFYSDVVVAWLGNDAAVLLGNDMLDNNFTKEQEDMYVQLQQMHEELTPKEKWADAEGLAKLFMARHPRWSTAFWVFWSL